MEVVQTSASAPPRWPWRSGVSFVVDRTYRQPLLFAIAVILALAAGILVLTLTGTVRGFRGSAGASGSSEEATLTFHPAADTYVSPANADTNYGSVTSIQVDNSPVKHILLRFVVSGVGDRRVTSATLRLYALDPSNAGGDIHRTQLATWSESAVTWKTAPTAETATVASLGRVAAGSWYETSVTPLVAGDGTVSLRFMSALDDGADYASKERGDGLAPQLVVTVTDEVPPENTTGPTITGTAREGETLTAQPGTWTGNPTSYRYQWRRCDASGMGCVIVAGTDDTYELTAADVGQKVRVVVTATNTAGSGTASSAAFGPIDPATPPSGETTVFGAAGDVGAQDRDAGMTLDAAREADLDFFLLLGDIGYDEVVPESAWCSWVFSHLGSGYPLQLISGNHEEDGGPDGSILEFRKCAPDRMNSSGIYGAEYYFDRGPVRVILIAADLRVGGVKYDYNPGTAHYAWLRDRIREAKTDGKWVVVGMHEVCLSAGNKPCSIGDSLQDLLLAEKVDLVLQGHDHDYQRFHSLRCANPGKYDAGCVADAGTDGAYVRSAGTVTIISGAAGRSATGINTSDAEYGYVAAWMGGQTANRGNGFLKVTVSDRELRGEFVNATNPTGYTDSFVISGNG